MIRADTLARLITVVEPTMNEGGKNRSSQLVQEMPVEKKSKTSSAAREGPPAAETLVINLTSSNGKKMGLLYLSMWRLPCRKWLVRLLSV